jgi:hypothetical protein
LSTRMVIAAVAVVAASVAPSVVRTVEAAAQGTVPRAPAQLDATRQLTNLLLQAGVVVQDVRPSSSLATMFPDNEEVAFILTNLGGIDLAVVKGENAAERIAVIYRKSSRRRLSHRYEFQADDGRIVGTTDSDGPRYFTLHNNWFIQTPSAGLDGILKQAFGQATALNR